ncbi:hypothetical protein J2Z60_000322 [Lactobacillus colini]|uniref:Uncharacterized protein n=1 Tax=Lactobacillus colini TaxID=1819254 RepID=A0ABS4MBV2_9LACO|nr:hypothetical protein [Lactobacillus colini]MBP2057160.1 hypothetical protein [Lactobacillus colini]
MYTLHWTSIQDILTRLISLNPDVDLIIHLKLDEVTYLQTPGRLKLSKLYLHNLELEYTKPSRDFKKYSKF